jgi:precorrin-6B methylase 2
MRSGNRYRHLDTDALADASWHDDVLELTRVAQSRPRVSRRLATISIGFLLCTALVETQDISTEPRRETWQRVPDLFAALRVREGARVADIGAGDGFLTVRLTRAVGESGVVYAVDSDAAVTGRLRERIQRERLNNVQVITSTDTDPRLPGSINGAVILNAYHEMQQGTAVLDHISGALVPGGRLVVCEPVPDGQGKTHTAQMEDHLIYRRRCVETSSAADSFRCSGLIRSPGISVVRCSDWSWRNDAEGNPSDPLL